MAERVDEEGHLLDEEDPENTGEQEGTQRLDGATVDPAEDGWKNESDREADEVAPAMLPHDERIALQVGHVVERRLGAELEEQPSDMGVEEAFGNVVGIVFVIDMLVVVPVVGDPINGRVLESGGPKNQSGQFDRPFGLEGQMGEEPVVTQSDAESGGGEVEEEQADLEGVEAVISKVNRNRGERDDRGRDEEGAGRPVDAIEREFK